MGRRLLSGGDGRDTADTELSLRTGGSSSRSSVVPASPQPLRSPGASSPASPLGGHLPLTIFYGGRICVCDVTDVQARAILAAAQRGTTEEREAAAPAAGPAREAQGEVAGEQLPHGGVLPRPGDVGRHPAQQQLGPGLSMKVSLQRFLQKRKSRADPGNAVVASASPYARPLDHPRPRYRHGLQQQQQQQQQAQLQRQASLFL